MLTIAVLSWLVCGALNECLVYIWARRAFDLVSFISLLALGPIFLAASSLLIVTGWVIALRLGWDDSGNHAAWTNESCREGTRIEEWAIKSGQQTIATQRQSQDVSSLAA